MASAGPEYAVHSLRRVQARVELGTFGVIILYFLGVALAIALAQDSDSVWLDQSFSLSVSALCPFVLLVNLYCVDATTYLLARVCGLVAGYGNESRRLTRLPVYAVLTMGVFLAALPAIVYVSPFAFFVFVVTALATWWWVPGRKTRHVLRNLKIQLDDLMRALVPSWPAGAPVVSDPMERDSGFVRRVLVVRTSDHIGVLRLIQEHGPATTIRFLPALTPGQLLVAAFPGLASVLHRAAPNRGQAAKEEDLREVVADWGERSHLEWHGVLDDGAQVVRNEGEVRIVPRDGAGFVAYRRLLAAHAPTIGVRRCYVQEGCTLRIEECALGGVAVGSHRETA